MDETVNKKAAKRKRYRLRQREKLRSLKEIQESLVVDMENQQKKSKEQVLAERQAKKAAKKSGKAPEERSESQKPVAQQKVSPSKEVAKVPEKSASNPVVKSEVPDKSKEEIAAQREAKKLAKQAAKQKSGVEKPQAVVENVKKTNSDTELAQKLEKLHLTDETAQEKSKTSKAERRALQEAQRAAKEKLKEEKAAAVAKAKFSKIDSSKTKEPQSTKPVTTSQVTTQKTSAVHKVRLFKHLYTEKCDLNINVNSHLHPAILKLGMQYANDTVVGSNARCYAFLNAMITLIKDFTTPPEKAFSRALETEIQTAVEFLQKCRPLAVAVANALKYVKLLISQERSTDSDEKKKQRIVDKIETYAHEQIETAAISISLKVREKIYDDDVILTFGCSSLIRRSLVEAFKTGNKDFSVVVVDSRPDHEGQEMLKSLTMEGISCTYVLINAISFIMPKVTKVILGAHALLANGYVMSRVGTAQIAMVANSFNVPVLICCETHKFSERVQTDSFVYNELGDPNALVKNKNSQTNFEYLKDWESIPHLTPLNLRYDITPPELVTAVVTEVALLPCTSVQVILRVKPSE